MENKNVKLTTDFVTTAASDFTSADPNKVLQYVILEGKGTKDFFSSETGVKYNKHISIISDADVDVSTGDISGYNTGSGSTTVQDVSLVNVQLKIFETYTKSALDAKILGLTEPGSDPAKLPLQDLIVDLKAKTLHAANEKMIWQSNTTNEIGDGILEQLKDASTYKSAGFGDTAFTGMFDSSILHYMKLAKESVQSNLPQYINSEMICAMSPANFAAYSGAVYGVSGTQDRNAIDGKPMTEMYIPGTNIKAVSTIGLNGSNEIVISAPDNIIVNYDLEGEDEIASMIYNPYAFRYELGLNYKLGVKVVNCAAVVKTT